MVDDFEGCGDAIDLSLGGRSVVKLGVDGVFSFGFEVSEDFGDGVGGRNGAGEEGVAGELTGLELVEVCGVGFVGGSA